MQSTQTLINQGKQFKVAIIKKTSKNSKNIYSRKFHHKVKMNHKKTTRTLLLLGHSDINQNGIFVSKGHRDFVIRTQLHSSSGQVYINTHLTLSVHSINIFTLGKVCKNMHSSRSLTHTNKKSTSVTSTHAGRTIHKCSCVR